MQSSCAVESRVTDMDKYCSSMVHLLRGRELGFRNAVTGNVTTWCTKHKMLQMCGNMYDCTGLFDDPIVPIHTLLHAMV